jgi:hypothetical protein
MATSNKDFRVKNGIQVAGDGAFNGTISAATPTSDGHLTTKGYVDGLLAQPNFPRSSAPPETANDGDLYFDTTFGRIAIYFGSAWTYIATIADAEFLPDHIHDTSIDGNGLIVTKFYDAGLVTDASGDFVDAGNAFTTTWATTWNGGTATDNFN